MTSFCVWNYGVDVFKNLIKSVGGGGVIQFCKSTVNTCSFRRNEILSCPVLTQYLERRKTFYVFCIICRSEDSASGIRYGRQVSLHNTYHQFLPIKEIYHVLCYLSTWKGVNYSAFCIIWRSEDSASGIRYGRQVPLSNSCHQVFQDNNIPYMSMHFSKKRNICFVHNYS
jgi:hypothetical protein